MNWTVIIDPPARKQLKKIPASDAKRISEVINELAVDPFSGDIEKMENYDDSWRRRSGNYRIFYWLYTKTKIIYIFSIKRRTSTTYK